MLMTQAISRRDTNQAVASRRDDHMESVGVAENEPLVAALKSYS
jgi:hypothetical protein